MSVRGWLYLRGADFCRPRISAVQSLRYFSGCRSCTSNALPFAMALCLRSDAMKVGQALNFDITYRSGNRSFLIRKHHPRAMWASFNTTYHSPAISNFHSLKFESEMYSTTHTESKTALKFANSAKQHHRHTVILKTSITNDSNFDGQ